MHNQDTTKDDIMESMMEILAKLREFYKIDSKKKGKEQDQEIDGENEVQSDDERVLKFQKAMKEIIKDTDNEKVAMIAQTFHDNPIESMRMLQAVVSDQVKQNANELVQMTSETTKILDQIRSQIDMNDPDALDKLQTLNALHDSENKKLELATNVVDGISPFYNENENIKTNTNDSQGINQQMVNGNTVNKFEEKAGGREKAEEIAKNYFEKEFNKDDFEMGSVYFNEKSGDYVVDLESVKDRGYSDAKIEINIDKNIGKEIHKEVTDEKGMWVSKFVQVNEFELNKYQEKDVMKNQIFEPKTDLEKVSLIANNYFKENFDAEKFESPNEPRLNTHTGEYEVKLRSKIDYGFKDATLKINLNSNSGKEVHMNVVDENGGWVNKPYEKNQFKMDKYLRNENEQEIEKQKDKHIERKRDQEMDGPER